MEQHDIDRLTPATGKAHRVKIDGNLYMNVQAKGSRSWLALHTPRHDNGKPLAGQKRQEIGLGKFPEVSYTDAMELAQAPDPKLAREEKFSAQGLVTFREGFNAVLHIRKQDWQAQDVATQAKGWQRDMDRHASAIMDRPIAAITPQDVAGVLDAATNSRTGARAEKTAKLLQQRMELVFDWASAQSPQLRADNPARASILRFIARRINSKSTPHGACPYEQVAELLAALPECTAGDCARFATLTAARIGEAAAATWDEFDLHKRLWTVPAERMKAKARHVVPLSQQAIDLLKGMERGNSHYPFAKQSNPAESISPKHPSITFRKTADRLHIMDADTGNLATMHGMRSAFTDWAVEAGHDRQDVLACLAHMHGTAADRAYMRTQAFERRREIMDAWGVYIAAGLRTLNPLERARDTVEAAKRDGKFNGTVYTG